MSEDARNLFTPWTACQGRKELRFGHVSLEGISIGTWEPMTALTKQPVTRFGIALQIPGFQKVVQPEQDRKVDLTRCVSPGRQPNGPGGQPLVTQSLGRSATQAGQNSWQQFVGIGKQVDCFKVQVDVRGIRGANADRVNAKR